MRPLSGAAQMRRVFAELDGVVHESRTSPQRPHSSAPTPTG
jgi:hypothetical protein